MKDVVSQIDYTNDATVSKKLGCWSNTAERCSDTVARHSKLYKKKQQFLLFDDYYSEAKIVNYYRQLNEKHGLTSGVTKPESDAGSPIKK